MHTLLYLEISQNLWLYTVFGNKCGSFIIFFYSNKSQGSAHINWFEVAKVTDIVCTFLSK